MFYSKKKVADAAFFYYHTVRLISSAAG